MANRLKTELCKKNKIFWLYKNNFIAKNELCIYALKDFQMGHLQTFALT